MKVAIVGAGFGGISTARELVRAGISDLEVTLIDQNPYFYIGLAKLWVATGIRSPESCQHPRDRLALDGVRFLNSAVLSIDREARTLDLGVERIEYDRLVVACGLDVRPDLIEGLEQHGLNLYSMTGAAAVDKVLAGIDSGVIHLVICRPPFKCPPAPYEAAMLIDDALRKRGVRDGVRLVVSTPEPRPLAVLPPDAGERVQKLLEERDIEFHPGRSVFRVGMESVQFNDVEEPFDALIAVPPHESPEMVKAFAPLVTDAGLIPADRSTLRTNFEGVFAIGDVAAVMTHTNLPIPRAGILAEAQGRVVASQIAADVAGSEPMTFDGEGYCFLEVGGGKAFKVDGHFLDTSGPSYDMSEAPSADLLEEKRLFEAERIDLWFS